jgi:hypothetical protein
MSTFDTSIAAAQLESLFSIDAIFKRRGRTVNSSNDERSLLFDLPRHAFPQRHFDTLHSPSFRKIVGAIGHSITGLTEASILSEVCGLSVDKVHERLKQAIDLGMIVFDNGLYRTKKPVGFGHTFEWYVAMVCKTQLASIAYWGVTIDGINGEYDVVLIREHQIGYIECKSGRLSNISKEDIGHFLARERILAPQFSICLVDGVSRKKLQALVDYALEHRSEYAFEIPGVMWHNISLEPEEYRHFIRLIPINAFFVSCENSVGSALREIYEFLTVVCDRSLPTENRAAKEAYRRQVIEKNQTQSMSDTSA